jgi:ATP-dependent DNA helicase RecG
VESPDAKEIVSFLRQTGGVSTGDVVEHLGLSRPTVVGRLRALQEIGLVIWEGKSTNDPRATWRLALGEEQPKTT